MTGVQTCALPISESIVEAQIDFDHPGHDGLAWAPGFQDVYHARDGAFAQARHVFLQGNGLPGRWQGRARFVILETGFGLGNNFLATWAAWRADPQRSKRLIFVSIDKHPVLLTDLKRAFEGHALPELAQQLIAAWPAPTPDIHRLSFDHGAVILLLVHADVQAALRELFLKADAFYLDGFAPARNPQMWNIWVTKALGRLLFESHILPFEILSVLLLVAMVGAILITKKDLR